MLVIIVATVFIIVMLLTWALIYPMVYRRVTVRNRVHRLMSKEIGRASCRERVYVLV